MSSDYLSESDILQMQDRIASCRERISSAARECGRDEKDITLIGVSKFFPASHAKAAYELGLHDLGENRVQEMILKQDELMPMGITPNWHLIGTLQTRKVKSIIGRTYLIHSVDSMELAEEINKRSLQAGVITPVTLQVNISLEESKHGFTKEDLQASMDTLLSMEGLSLRGIMTMAPIETHAGAARKVFSETKAFFDSLQSTGVDQKLWHILSMGMSGDYADAIREGATHIRIGTAIFGPRILQ